MEALKPHSLISIWFKPRKTIRYLTHYYQSPSSHFRIIVGLACIYFIQLSLLMLQIDSFPAYKFLTTVRGLQVIALVFLSIGLYTFIGVSTSAVVFWMSAKSLKGHGSLPMTRTALLWTMICTIPIGFVCLLLMFITHHAHLTPARFIIEAVSCVGLLVSLIYGFIVILKTISETHSFGLWRALFAIILGSIIECGIVFTIVIFHKYLWQLFALLNL